VAALCSRVEIKLKSKIPDQRQAKAKTEVEVTLPFVEFFPARHVLESEFSRCEQDTPQARPSAKGEFQ
jgi:hypothetical protein